MSAPAALWRPPPGHGCCRRRRSRWTRAAAPLRRHPLTASGAAARGVRLWFLVAGRRGRKWVGGRGGLRLGSLSALAEVSF